MLTLTREQSSFFFDPKATPAGEAGIGDRVKFQTKDCFSDELRTDRDLATAIDMSYVNPCTGPLFVTGAKPGSVLVVEIEKIALRDWGVLTLIPHEGILDEFIAGPVTKIVPIVQTGTTEGYVEFASDIHLDLRPHVGTIGTTPMMRTATGRAYNHGGNMDIQKACVGSRIYFPVFVEGGMLMMGDVHANMGDGELCIGVETAADVTISIVDIHRDVSLIAPMIETETHWITYADAPTGKIGVREVCCRMSEFLSSRAGLSNEDASLLISTCADIRFAQWSENGANYTFYLEFPKKVFLSGKLNKFTIG